MTQADNKTRMIVFSLSTVDVQMKESSQILFRFCSDAEVKLVNSTNLLCYLCGSQPKTGSFFHF